ncbi:hypothetical protein KBD20_03235 [Candidatus Saccharibacteria bacterium]|nr:hypothetical protein [Candidatus Saccharibacteria bacterium]
MNIPLSTHPYTGDYHIVVTSRVDKQVLEAMEEMTELGLPNGELISAILHGMSPSPYIRARKLGHTHQETLDVPYYVESVYLRLREDHGCTEVEAAQVFILTTSDSEHGTNQRDFYRTVRNAGRSHDDARRSMILVKPCLDTTFDVVNSDRNLRLNSLKGFLAKALEVDIDSSINDIWRAWLKYNGQTPYDAINEAVAAA